MKPDEMKERTMQFAIRIARLIESLPRTRIGRLVEDQLGRAGTGVGANCRAACKARSRKEFIAKIGTVEEEADESCFWLEFIVRGELLKPQLVAPLLAGPGTRQDICEITEDRSRERKQVASPCRQSAIGNRKWAILE